jgi:hypothetical protein
MESTVIGAVLFVLLSAVPGAAQGSWTAIHRPERYALAPIGIDAPETNGLCWRLARRARGHGRHAQATEGSAVTCECRGHDR